MTDISRHGQDRLLQRVTRHAVLDRRPAAARTVSCAAAAVPRGSWPDPAHTQTAQQANAALHHAQTVDAAAVNHALHRPPGAQGQRAGSGCWGDRQALRRTSCRAWAERRSAGTGLPTWPPQDVLLPGVPWFCRGRPLLQSWRVWFSLR
ncbi:hypothetical protein QR90_12760 [Deinococcus radiopugnans]|uniref:Uncharacterized protein n=1 Tax=Deinococcus radiopugnans TaxID=57497 RepID=A0A0A7KHV2_9DEIO|nr:hypothetical protein QR90_12760 [Deinococcus radiopugnans]